MGSPAIYCHGGIADEQRVDNGGMESEWIEGEDGIAADVWRSSHTKWGWVFGRLFIGCLIVAMLTGELWPDPLQLPVNIAIMAIVPAMGAKLWQRHERIDIPSGLIGVGTDRLPVEPLSLYEGNADDDPMLSPVKAVLWQRGMRGEFAWPVRADGQLVTGMFAVDGDRIRLTDTRPADPTAKAMVDKDPESFDKAFPNPTVIADSNQWIAYDPNGRLPRK